MSDNEVQHLKDDLTEIKADVKDIAKMVNDMRVTLAGEYSTKKEHADCLVSCTTTLKEHETKERSSRRWWAGFVVAASSIVMTILSFLKVGAMTK